MITPPRLRRTLLLVLLTAAMATLVAFPLWDAATSGRESRTAGPQDVAGTVTPTRTLHVEPRGNDGHPGTAAKPLRSLQRAASLVTAGTTVVVAPGVYAPVRTTRSGRAAQRIVFLSRTQWGARITTSGSTAPWTNEGSFVDIIGFDATAPNAAQGIISTGSFVRILRNRLVSVALHETHGAGAGINHAGYDTSGNEVSDNRVSDVGPPGNLQVHGIYVSQAGTIIRRNVVNRVSGWCLHAWHASTRITVEGNTVFDCGTAGVGGGGIVAGAGDGPGGVVFADSTIADNVVRDSVDGIRVGGRTGAFVVVRDNAVVDSGQ